MELAGYKNLTLRRNRNIGRILRRPWLYILMIPGIIHIIIFEYIPVWGLALAFKDYNPVLGFFNSPWVGLKHFYRFFSLSSFYILLRNTLVFFALSLMFYFPIPIILALMLNELKNIYFKRTIQTIVYLPHFLSWVVIMSITYVFFTPAGGVIPNLLDSIGMGKVNILMNPKYFRAMIVGQQIWKEAGWGTIIFLAAITGIPIELYESAIIDGATRWQQARYITIPSISSLIVIILILRLGNILNVGHTQLILMITPPTRDVGEVFDTYIYRNGIQMGLFSYTTAVGLFKMAIGAVMVALSHSLAKKVRGEGLF